MKAIRVHCPAKVNLSLAVGPPDKRGYHPIHTVFQAVSLFDELVIRLADEPEFSCDSPEVPADNTVTRALRLLGEIALVPPLRVRLTKRIPAESGLGGGSSDAAGLLRVINRFLPAPIEEHHLFDIALAVGADVPFFLVGGQAIGAGYGEVLTPLPDEAPVWLVIVRPPALGSTKVMYDQLDRARAESGAPVGLSATPGVNDFEHVMPKECGEWRARLQEQGASMAMLSGSGSAVYGRFDSQAHATVAADSLKLEWGRRYGQGEGDVPVWVTRTLSRLESLAVESL